VAPWIYTTVRVVGFVSGTAAVLRRDLKARKTTAGKALNPRSWSRVSLAAIAVSLVGTVVVVVWAAATTPS